ncbi:hypothetical protein [Marinobacter metalliresistant]|uniref:Uncharacterized protein n=1 Tax=Marinobacter metalliresistant TaxID=2961995 RepID=A0ABZ2W7H9_9GAMM
MTNVISCASVRIFRFVVLIVFTITGQLCFAGERFDPFVSAISRIDKDEGLVYIDRHDNVVEVGDVFVTAKPVQNGDASMVGDRRSVIGILRINPEEFVGKLLSGPMPGVNAVVERFGPLPAVIKSTTEKSGPVEEELKSMFPRLVWENEESKAEPSLTFELISKGRVVVTYDRTWLVGVVDVASYPKEENFHGAGELDAELVLELPGRASSIAANEISGRYLVALEDKQKIRFFSGQSDGPVSEIADIAIPRGERIIYMDWYNNAGDLYLLVNQWDDYRVSSSVVKLDRDRALLVGFSPLMMGVHDTDLDGRSETILGQSYTAEHGFGSKIYTVVPEHREIVETANETFSALTPGFRVLGSRVLGKTDSGAGGFVSAFDGKVSVYSGNGPELKLSYDYDMDLLPGSEIRFEVNPELIFSPTRTLSLGNPFVGGTEGTEVSRHIVGIAQRPTPSETGGPKDVVAIDWLDANPDSPSVLGKTRVSIPRSAKAAYGSGGLFFFSAESRGGDGKAGEGATRLYRLPADLGH